MLLPGPATGVTGGYKIQTLQEKTNMATGFSKMTKTIVLGVRKLLLGDQGQTPCKKMSPSLHRVNVKYFNIVYQKYESLIFKGDELDILFLAGREGNPTFKIEEQDKIVILGDFKENRGDKIFLEIPIDKNVFSSVTEIKWISVGNNVTLDMLARLDFKMGSSGATAMPMTVASIISCVVLVCIIVISVVMIIWRKKSGKKEDDERINENQLNEINELRPGENDTYDTYAYDTYTGEMKTEGDYDCYYTQ